MIERLRSFPELPVYLMTGGASVGDYDLAKQLFMRLRIPILFDSVAIKPGMPIIAGLWGNSLLIALSGNPAACSVSFELLIRPLIRQFAGFAQLEHTRVMAKLVSNFGKPSPSRRFVWAVCFEVNGLLSVMPLDHQGNGMLRQIANANALLDVPANSPPLEKGTNITTLLLSSSF